MKEKFQAGVAEKQVIAVRKERERLNMIVELKEKGGPFTNPYEVEKYMKSDITEAKKQKRIKKENQFAKELSAYFSKSDPLFRVKVTLPNKIRRDIEFSISLKALLRQYSTNQSSATMQQFRDDHASLFHSLT
ncbi:hypothetical protein HELRODRAFT_166030 [Helobdella robusta]|uniref:Uncharacterized protein n=1 Tax=Helobdella robusta TaxID=6412 RepID=T1EXM2_HELRO|nr:hypothetical protein HELRODRAFT_166030 [Helobdella robusta]ESN90370.1 hypothetical protein HELRODRAFT_166030 [Helobdella robusta]